jgi:opacity protein-like surface antigen
MKMHFRSVRPLTIGGCVLLQSAVTAIAQPVAAQPAPGAQPNQWTSPATPWYVRVDAGIALTQDTDLKEFFGPVTPGSRVKFDPGVRFAYGGGFRFSEFFALEAETGVMANYIDSITDANDIDQASLANIPFLVNLRFDVPGFPVNPYFGGGAGGAIAVIDSDNLDVGGTSVSGSDSDVVFAYQAFAGLRYAINDNMGVGISYHYFATTEPSWEADNSAGHIKFGRIETHTVTFAFDYRF